MNPDLKKRGFWIAGAFILCYLALLTCAVTGLLSIPKEVFFAFPFALVGAYFYFFHFGDFAWAAIAFIPLSINFADLGGGLGLSIPIEPMLLGIALIFIFRQVSKGGIPRQVLRHPLTLLIFLQTIWVAATLLKSSYSEVSLKFLVARLVYIAVYYFFFIELFKKRKNIKKFLFLYLLGYIPVILYSLQRIGANGFSRPYSPVMAEPFYSDHTILGACIAMLLPICVLYYFNRKKLIKDKRLRSFVTFSLFVLVFGVIFSYSRAAWLSLIVVMFLRLLFMIRLSYGLIVAGLGVMVGFIYYNGENIVEAIRSREIRSGDSFFEHAQSVANVNTDESNLERINRWSCALRMYKDRPFWGYGPGTYERNYGTYQRLEETTRISSWDGDRGDAHSEYFTALSEQGMPGLIFLLLIIFYSIRLGMRVYYQARDPETRLLALGILLGLFTYYVHGGVNSFLDIDKAASLFWAMTAMLLALEMYHKNAESSQGFSEFSADLVEKEEPGYLGGNNSGK